MVRATTSLILLVAFGLVAFGWRTVIQVRRHGDTGWRLRPDSDPIARVASLLFVASLVLAAAAPTAALVTGSADRPWGLEALVRPDSTLASVAFAVGAILMVVGSAVAVVAQIQMGSSWRIGLDADERTELVTGGLFARVRNPIFSGMLLGLVGQMLLVPTALAVAATVAGVVGLQLQVRRIEEPYLVAVHGGPYRAWAATSGRFVPGLGKL